MIYYHTPTTSPLCALCCSLLFLLSAPLQAQHLERQVVASAGDYHQAAGIGSLHWTLGETVTETLISGSVRLSQGFHQLYVLAVNVDEPTAEGFSLKVFPNPASSSVSIQTEHNEPLQWQLLDISGKLLRSQSLPAFGLQTIDIHALPAGVYLLRATNERRLVRTFKIVKIQQ